MPSTYALGSRYEKLIQDLVRTGRYNNASDVVRDALQMLEERERKLATLDAAIADGLADLNAGRARDIEEVRADILSSLSGRRRNA